MPYYRSVPGDHWRVKFHCHEDYSYVVEEEESPEYKIFQDYDQEKLAMSQKVTAHEVKVLEQFTKKEIFVEKEHTETIKKEQVFKRKFFHYKTKYTTQDYVQEVVEVVPNYSTKTEKVNDMKPTMPRVQPAPAKDFD